MEGENEEKNNKQELNENVKQQETIPEETKNVEQKENKKPEATSVKKEKKSKKGLIITLIVIIILVVIGILAFVGWQYFNNNKTVGTTWGDTYYAYLRKASSNKETRNTDLGLADGTQNVELEFIDIEEEEEPLMVMSYDSNDSEYINLYYINSSNEVNKVNTDVDSDIEYLYNIPKKEYSWYIHKEDTNTDTYIEVGDYINDSSNNEEYVFEKDEKEDDTTDNSLENPINITKFDETFIVVDLGDNKVIEINLNEINDSKLHDAIYELVTGYVSTNDKLTAEVVNKITEQVTHVEDILKQLYSSSIENGVIKAGDYSLKLGRYVDKYNTVYILNEDGIASCTCENGLRDEFKNGEYVVYNYNEYKNEINEWEKQNGPIGFSGEWMIAIAEKVDKEKPYLTYSYSISGDNTFYNGQTDEEWKYKEEKEDDKEKQDEVNKEETKNDSTSKNKSTFKVGSYTLHYGTYKGTTSQYSDELGRPVSYTLTFKFNQDGTYSIKSSNQSMVKDESGKFKVTTLQGMNVIELDNGAYYTSYGNDSIGELAGAGSTFEYQG